MTVSASFVELLALGAKIAPADAPRFGAPDTFLANTSREWLQRCRSRIASALGRPLREQRLPPDLWLAIYYPLLHCNEDLFFAGGALRDWDNGRPIKDLDFFWAGDEELIFEMINVLRCMGYIVPARGERGGLMLSRNDEGRSMEEGQIINTWIFHHSDPAMPPVNFVRNLAGLDTIEKAVARFDFGICQIGFDGVEVYRSENYLADQENHTFTLCDERKGDHLERSYQRFQRLEQKYRGWTMLDPWALARVFAGVAESVEKIESELEIDF